MTLFKQILHLVLNGDASDWQAVKNNLPALDLTDDEKNEILSAIELAKMAERWKQTH